MKLATIGAVAVAALLLAACSGGNGPVEPSATPSTTAIADGPTATPGPTVGNLDDPLCAAVAQNVEDATDLEAKTAELTELMQDPSFLTSTDPSALNEWGSAMLELTSASQEFYQLGVSETEGEDVNADFVTLSTFVEKYSNALALAAADATSNTDFFAGVQGLFTESEMREIAAGAPDVAKNVAVYLGTRCAIAG